MLTVTFTGKYFRKGGNTVLCTDVVYKRYCIYSMLLITLQQVHIYTHMYHFTTYLYYTTFNSVHMVRFYLFFLICTRIIWGVAQYIVIRFCTA